MKRQMVSRSIIIAVVFLINAGLLRAEALLINDFSYAMPITFSGYTGSTVLTNFPVLVKLSVAIPGFSYDHFAAGGVNLRFADSDNHALDYEVDTWNASGTSLVWVRIPELSSTTRIWAYWGSNDTEHAPCATNGSVWVSGAYAGVWHLNEDAALSSDSGANRLHGTNLTGTAYVADGKIGAARKISAASKGVKDSTCGIAIPNYNALTVENTFTISAWLAYKAGQTPGYDRIFSRKSAYNDSNGWEVTLRDGSTTAMDHRGADGNSQQSSVFTNISDGVWHLLTVTYDGTSTKAYMDGGYKAVATITAATDNGKVLMLGNNAALSEVCFKGTIDETRLRDAVSAADWIAAEYATVAKASFATYGELVDLTLPVLTDSAVAATAFHSADLIYVLAHLGAAVPDVLLAYGTDAAVLDRTNTVATSITQTGTFTNTLSGLTCNTTYFFKFIATNVYGASETTVSSFTTPGSPVLGAPAVIIDGTTLTVSNALTDVGVAAATVSLWFGTSSNALAQVEEWPDCAEPQVLSHTWGNQTFGTYYAAFRAYNVCSGVTNEVWTPVVSGTVSGTCTWTGAAGDSNWNTAANWSSGTVPGTLDTACFTDTGLASGASIAISANQQIDTLLISTALSFTLGIAADATATNTLAFANLTREDVAGTEGTVYFAAPILILGGTNGIATWAVNGSNGVRVNGPWGTPSGVSVTLRATGTAALSLYPSSSTFTGVFEQWGGTVTAAKAGVFKGNVTVGGSTQACTFNYSVGTAISGGKTLTVLTNGFFEAWGNGPDYQTISSIVIKDGGIGHFTSTWNYINNVDLTGGSMTGAGRLFQGGYNVHLNSHASARTAEMYSGFNFGGYYTYAGLISVEDGAAPIDFIMHGAVNSASTGGGQTIARSGAGTAVFTSASDYRHNSGTNSIGWRFQGGRSIFNNTTGSAVGKNPTQVDGGATLGGTGFLGGDSAYTNFYVLVQGSSTSSLATVAPGSVDASTGDSLIGTLTVGSATLPNKVTFGNYSRLQAQVGADGQTDCLMVYGSVDLSSASDGLVLSVDEHAKAGIYVLLNATGGITGSFDNVTGLPDNRKLTYSATTLSYEIPPQGTRISIW